MSAPAARPDGSKVVLCPACGTVSKDLGPGPGGRPSALCRHCGSLERHRFLALAAAAFRAAAGPGLLLDVAPSRQLSSLLRTVANGAYVAIDFDPAADGRLVDVQASLTDIPLPDRSVAMIVCSHVLEHVPDDRRAMHEMARVLVPDGLLLVLIPWRAGPTDEDPSATESERLRRFGQADHVRYYGDDFEDRLRDAGLEPTVMQPHQVIAPDVLEVTGIAPDEKLWLCRRSGSQILDMGTLAETVGRQATSQLVEALRQVVAREPEPEPPREPGPAPTPESTAHSMYRRLRRTRLGRQSAALLRPLRRGR